MRFGFIGGPWILRDRFGDEWRISLVDRVDRKPDGGAGPADARGIVGSLVFQTFSFGGATHDERASVLLQVYDELTNRRLAEELPRPTNDPRRLLRAFDAELRDTLFHAVANERIRVERVVPPPWPFPDPPDAPVAPELDVPVPEQTTFIALLLVDQDGNPVPGRSYQITMPDGTVVQGTLDSQGTARVADIASPGQCVVTFPEFDQKDWSAQTAQAGSRATLTGPPASAPDGGADSSAGATGAAAPDSAPASSPDGTPPDRGPSGATGASAPDSAPEIASPDSDSSPDSGSPESASPESSPDSGSPDSASLDSGSPGSAPPDSAPSGATGASSPDSSPDSALPGSSPSGATGAAGHDADPGDGP